MTKTIIRQCLALLPEGDGFKTAESDIVIEDGVITAVENAGEAKAESGDKLIAGTERLAALSFRFRRQMFDKVIGDGARGRKPHTVAVSAHVL